MATFHQYTFHQLMFDVPLKQVYAMYSWATLNDPMNRFSGIIMVNGGYLGNEADMLYEDLKKIMQKK